MFSCYGTVPVSRSGFPGVAPRRITYGRGRFLWPIFPVCFMPLPRVRGLWARVLWGCNGKVEVGMQLRSRPGAIARLRTEEKVTCQDVRQASQVRRFSKHFRRLTANREVREDCQAAHDGLLRTYRSNEDHDEGQIR